MAKAKKKTEAKTKAQPEEQGEPKGESKVMETSEVQKLLEQGRQRQRREVWLRLYARAAEMHNDFVELGDLTPEARDLAHSQALQARMRAVHFLLTVLPNTTDPHEVVDVMLAIRTSAAEMAEDLKALAEKMAEQASKAADAFNNEIVEHHKKK